jgi:protein-L-isoaspartate(D-aspartate) O-methyltransferase
LGRENGIGATRERDDISRMSRIGIHRSFVLPVCAVAVACEPAPIVRAENLTDARQRMVREQIAARDVKDPRVLQALETVPRHEFVPAELRGSAYEDRPLPIGHGQTISQPYIVALMSEQLMLKPNAQVLEIGTGSGYQAAVLGQLAAEVYTIEIVSPLASRAWETLRRLGYHNVHVSPGDGYQGWPDAAPFDAIIVTCAPDHVPEPLVEQLKEGGRMVIPVGDFGAQELYVLEKRDGKIKKKAVLPVRFVPMTGKAEKAPRK